MLKLITLALPLLMKGRSGASAKQLAGRLAVYGLMFGGFLCVLAALFVWVSKTYNLELAFLAVGGIFLVGAICAAIATRPVKRDVKKAVMPETIDSDYLAAYLPDSVVQDPVVQKFLKEISDRPLSATAAAVTLGVLISRELFD